MRRFVNSLDGQSKKGDNRDEPELILSVCYAGGLLGAAYYSVPTQSIHILCDESEDADFRLLDALTVQVKPDIIIVNKAQDLQLLAHLQDKCSTTDGPRTLTECNGKDVPETLPVVPDSTTEANEADDEWDTDSELEEDCESNSPELVILSNNAFRFDTSCKRVRELFGADDVTWEEQDLILKFRLDLTKTCMMRSAGALLMYMDAARVGVAFEPLNISTPVKRIKKFMIGRRVDIDGSTYRALDIFTDQKRKELRYSWTCADASRLSIFSLCNRCRSGAGKLMLKQWFEHPTTNREELDIRQKAISFLIQDANADVYKFLHSHLGKIKNIRAILKRLNLSVMKAIDWRLIYQTCQQFRSIGEFFRDRGVELELIKPFMNLFNEDLNELCILIISMVDFQMTEAENRLIVNEGIDPDLDFYKSAVNELDNYLHQQSIMESEYFEHQVQVTFSRAFRYVVLIPDEQFDPGHPRITDVVFQSGGFAHVKTPLMYVLDEKIGNLQAKIVDKETAITLRLQEVLHKNSRLLLGILRATALLDAAMALSLTAKQHGWTRPLLVDDPIIDVYKAYHPLACIVSKKKFVPNDISSGGINTRIKIFTGPNASGKSVYLKQVGIVAYLAHIGSFVPAERAVLGPINHIITRMYTVDGVLDGMSTFAHDLSQLATAITRASTNSLIIIDEFGKGTLAEVGLSLLAATLNRWISAADTAPHVFVSSHFHALPELLEKNGSIVSFHAMDATARGCEMFFHYKVVDGMASSSYAAYMAREMGVDEEVADRAAEVYSKLREGANLLNVPHSDLEDRKNEWLYDRMGALRYRFENTDLANDDQMADLIDEIAKSLLCSDPKTFGADLDDKNTHTNAHREPPTIKKVVMDTPKIACERSASLGAQLSCGDCASPKTGSVENNAVANYEISDLIGDVIYRNGVQFGNTFNQKDVLACEQSEIDKTPNTNGIQTSLFVDDALNISCSYLNSSARSILKGKSGRKHRSDLSVSFLGNFVTVDGVVSKTKNMDRQEENLTFTEKTTLSPNLLSDSVSSGLETSEVLDHIFSRYCSNDVKEDSNMIGIVPETLPVVRDSTTEANEATANMENVKDVPVEEECLERRNNTKANTLLNQSEDENGIGMISVALPNIPKSSRFSTQCEQIFENKNEPLTNFSSQRCPIFVPEDCQRSDDVESPLHLQPSRSLKEKLALFSRLSEAVRKGKNELPVFKAVKQLIVDETIDVTSVIRKEENVDCVAKEEEDL